MPGVGDHATEESQVKQNIDVLLSQHRRTLQDAADDLSELSLSATITVPLPQAII